MKNKRKHSDLQDKDIIQKYLEGRMSPEEAHQFERRVLQDPFYQDALDGLESLDPEDADQDLSLLSERIRSRTGLYGVKPVYHYRIAAAIALLAVFSYFIYQFIHRIDEVSGPEAVTQNIAKPEDAPTEETMPADELKIPAEAETGLPDQEVPEAVHPDPGKTASELELQVDDDTPEIESEEMQENEKITMETIRYIDPAARDVADDMDVAAAPITSDADTPETEIREKSQAGRSDAAPRRSPAAPAALAERAYSTEPLIGFEAYAKYIKENIQYPEKEAEEGLEGVVEIRFTVDEDSTPVNLQVLRSLSRDCDQEAIRLLKEGPAWRPMYDASGRFQEAGVSYRIEFKLRD